LFLPSPSKVLQKWVVKQLIYCILQNSQPIIYISLSCVSNSATPHRPVIAIAALIIRVASVPLVCPFDIDPSPPRSLLIYLSGRSVIVDAGFSATDDTEFPVIVDLKQHKRLYRPLNKQSGYHTGDY